MNINVMWTMNTSILNQLKNGGNTMCSILSTKFLSTLVWPQKVLIVLVLLSINVNTLDINTI